MTESKLFVANLSSRCVEDDLRGIFEKYGKIIEINIKEKRDKFAFVEFADIREAENALKEDGSELLGRNIKVELANRNKRRDDRRDDRYGGRDSRDDRRGGDRRGSYQDRPRGPIKCYNCQEDGHIAKDCPNPRVERRDNRSRDERPRNDGKCFNCNKEGHKKFECPEARNGGGDRDRRRRSRSDSRGRRRDSRRSRSRSPDRRRLRRSPSYEKRRRSPSDDRRRKSNSRSKSSRS